MQICKCADVGINLHICISAHSHIKFMNEEFLSYTFLDNPLNRWLWFAVSILLAFILKKFISKSVGLLLYRLFRKLSKENLADEFIELVVKPIQYFIIILTIYIGLGFLKFPSALEFNIQGIEFKTINILVLHIILSIAFVWLLLRIIDFISIILAQKAAETENKLDDQLVPYVKDALKIFVVVIGIFFILGAVLKFNINSLLAGLGIGGLAIAFAAKDTIENLISSFTIFIDRPFTVGDLVKVGDVTGTVEKVGFRSTRIRTSNKTFLTVPNSKIVNSNLDNLTLRTFRNVEFNFGLTYQTSSQQIKSIISDIKQILDQHPKTDKKENLVTFHQFGESALIINVQYFIEQIPNNDFMKIKETVNFGIMEIVKRHNAEFGFPTRTVHITK